jgi:hypothetical protein
MRVVPVALLPALTLPGTLTSLRSGPPDKVLRIQPGIHKEQSSKMAFGPKRPWYFAGSANSTERFQDGELDSDALPQRR